MTKKKKATTVGDKLEKEMEKSIDYESLVLDLEYKLQQLQDVLNRYEEDDNKGPYTPEETICVQQVAQLKEMSKLRELDLDEIKKFDLLNKNLRMIRGVKKKPEKEDKSDMSTDNLLAIVDAKS